MRKWLWFFLMLAVALAINFLPVAKAFADVGGGG